MGNTDVRHAFAVLELSAPVTEASLKQHYKGLVRRWHPDRFQNDPAGQAEATIKLRNINLAYEVVLASIEPGAPPPYAEPSTAEPFVVPPTAKTTHRRVSLSREQIDANIH